MANGLPLISSHFSVVTFAASIVPSVYVSLTKLCARSIRQTPVIMAWMFGRIIVSTFVAVFMFPFLVLPVPLAGLLAPSLSAGAPKDEDGEGVMRVGEKRGLPFHP